MSWRISGTCQSKKVALPDSSATSVVTSSDKIAEAGCPRHPRMPASLMVETDLY